MYENVILDHQELAKEILNDKKIIERDIITEKLLKFVSHPNILTILGVRRCGKTVLSLQLLKNKNFMYVNFDDERLYNISHKDLNEILKTIYQIGDPEFIIFDEIQNVKGWELFLNRLRYSKKIIITGSNSRLLSSELATHLTGRHVDFVLYPFSFREHLRIKGIEIKTYYSTKEESKIKKELKDYLNYGGFPERYRFGKEFIKVIYSDIKTKDVVMREKIKKIEELERFANFLISNFSCEISIRNMRDSLRLHIYTIEKWLKALENAFLIFTIDKFDFKAKRRLRSQKKLYVVDNGICNIVSFGISENIGKLMENLVAVELFRRKSYFNKDLEIYFYKDHQGKEIDFLIKERNRIKQLIQVTYASSFQDVKEREWKNLLLIYDFLKKYGHNPELLVITWDYEDKKELSWFGKKGKIKFMPLWKWLLNL